MTSSAALVLKIEKILNDLNNMDNKGLPLIIAEIENLRVTNKQFRNKFNVRKSEFELYKSSAKYKRDITIFNNYIKHLSGIYNLKMTSFEKLSDNYDFWFNLKWLYNLIPDISKELLKNNERIDSAFHLYYSIANYAYALLEKDDEIYNLNKDFNYLIASMKEKMDNYSDFYLYDLYKNDKINRRCKFFIKVMSIIINNILNLLKDDLKNCQKHPQIKATYNNDLQCMFLDEDRVELTPEIDNIMRKINNNKAEEINPDCDKVDISRFNKKIRELVGIQKIIYFNKKKNIYEFNTTDFDFSEFNMLSVAVGCTGLQNNS